MSMEFVLAVSVTSTAVRWVRVEDKTGEPVDRGSLDVDALASFDPGDLLAALLGDEPPVADAAEGEVRRIGITWTPAAEAAAGAVLEALAIRGVDSTVVVPQVDSAEALARGIADIAGYPDVAVCIVEPDVVIVAMVGGGEVMVDVLDRVAHGGEPVDVTGHVTSILEVTGRQPDALFVVGSDVPDTVVPALADAVSSPVISAAEADLAMARGVALRMTGGPGQLDAARPRLAVGALASVLVAAVVTFVVSGSVAVTLLLTPDTERPRAASEQPAGVTIPEVATRPLPAAPPPPAAVQAPAAAPVAPPEVVATAEALPPAEAPPAEAPPVAQTVAVAPPPEAVPMAPPAPVYVPPPPVPAPPPQPRLRDRIIERIPILNRFHEPQYPNP